MLILEPIFEADLLACAHGFRPGRSAHTAIEEIRQNIRQGSTQIYDADLKGYFDSIPDDKLLACVQMCIKDGSVLGLLRQWLRAPVIQRSRFIRKGTPVPETGALWKISAESP